MMSVPDKAHHHLNNYDSKKCNGDGLGYFVLTHGIVYLFTLLCSRNQIHKSGLVYPNSLIPIQIGLLNHCK